MPKLRATPEELAMRRFNGFVLEGMHRRNLKQEDLAKELGLLRQSVGYRLSGKAAWKLKEVIAICIFFGEDYSILTGGKG